jgi:hypothetical protein
MSKQVTKSEGNFFSKSSSKCLWNVSEDRVLYDVVQVHKPKNWNFIATLVRGRSAKQCRERWHNHVDPSLKKGKWTPEEDMIITKMIATVGFKWALIAKSIPGRADNDIKNRYNRHLKKAIQPGRQFSNDMGGLDYAPCSSPSSGSMSSAPSSPYLSPCSPTEQVSTPVESETARTTTSVRTSPQSSPDMNINHKRTHSFSTIVSPAKRKCTATLPRPSELLSPSILMPKQVETLSPNLFQTDFGRVHCFQNSQPVLPSIMSPLPSCSSLIHSVDSWVQQKQGNNQAFPQFSLS